MKQKIVGVYYAGNEQYQLVLREGMGGEFYLCPEPGSLPRIKVGAEQDSFEGVVNVLLHELFELILTKLNTRYTPTEHMAHGHDIYVFHFNHCQFTECCGRAAEFITDAMPDLKKCWKEFNKKKRG